MGHVKALPCSPCPLTPTAPTFKVPPNHTTTPQHTPHTQMFLDEPTSGLDAAAAYFVMDSVRKLAAAHRTILTVIHQPASEVFELFDK